MQLILDTNGLMVKKRNNSFWIMSKTQKRMISPHRVSSIAVTGDCLISSAAIKLATDHKIPIFFFNASGKIKARLWSENFGSIADIREQQVMYKRSPLAIDWVIGLFKLKGEHQKECLQTMIHHQPQLAHQLKKNQEELGRKMLAFERYKGKLVKDHRNALMGIEGNIAKVYWKSLSAVLPEELQFTNRSRRPARDVFNAGLNYLYGMLYGVVGSAIFAVGLDPYMGFLHVNEYNRPSFTFDMIEPFRPWIDQLLMERAIGGHIKLSFFTQKEESFRLNKAGKRFFIPLFNNYMEEKITFEGRKLSRKNHIYHFAGEFAQELLKQNL